ncbi:hypothetical protein UFOVP208_36 [uncultured Caudovirales phage]|uniref:Uncharacterized protein n=1 Tax=uncultured Caudovirales phage TaxID=2100421 RepID=A0A6J7WJQ4_9CAUD|nr:hypothetical protein UFOVP208_36 [uncultured Caudovirales phage]
MSKNINKSNEKKLKVYLEKIKKNDISSSSTKVRSTGIKP